MLEKRPIKKGGLKSLVLPLVIFAISLVISPRFKPAWAQSLCEIEGGVCCAADSQTCSGSSSPLPCSRGSFCCFGNCQQIPPAPTQPPGGGCGLTGGNPPGQWQCGGNCPSGQECKKVDADPWCKCLAVPPPPPPPPPTISLPPPNFLTPFPQPPVPCNEVRPSEFHSLRPYQASPCNPNAEDLALFCGNDVVLTDTIIIQKNFSSYFYDWTYTFEGNLINPMPPAAPNYSNACSYCNQDGVCVPRDPPCIPDVGCQNNSANCVAQECIDNGDGTETCTFNVDRVRDIAIDLLGAYLPIMGNTELVVNSQKQPNPEELNDAAKVNEYVSWYMNGLIGRAEYNPPDVDTEEGKRRIIDFSGPLKRLLSFDNQIFSRIGEIKDAQLSLKCNPNAIPKDPNCIRHDQIIGCVNSLNQPTQCYPDRPLVTKKRLSDWLGNLPPLSWAYSTYQSYKTALTRWKIENPIWRLFTYVPFSSTEDRKGEVDFGTYRFQPSSGNFVILDSAIINQKPADLFFSHMQESFELADLLQQIFSPKGANLNALESGPASSTYAPYCNIQAVRSNPGDNLFPGEMSATVTYTAQVTCTFCIPDPDIPGNLCRCLSGGAAGCQSGYDFCATDYGQVDCGLGETCGSGCINFPKNTACDRLPPLASSNPWDGPFSCYPTAWGCTDVGQVDCGAGFECADDDTCNKPPPKQINLTQTCTNNVLVSFKTITKTPLADEVWNKLVAGPASVFKRMFPKIEDAEGRPIRSLWDIPAATSVVYKSLTPGVSVIAGNPASGRGTQGELYFPHVGGIHEYFLKCIQKTIRPQGFGEGCISAPDTPPPDTGGMCPPVADSAIPTKYQGIMKENFIRLANIWTADCPGPENNLAEECYNYVVRESVKAGVNPAFSLTIWANESGASNYCHGGPTTQDFGINLSSLYQNLVGQLAAFLQLPTSSTYTSCRATCSSDPACFDPMLAFMAPFKSGQCVYGPGTPGRRYYDNVKNFSWQVVTEPIKICVSGNLFGISWPTDNSCP